MLDQLKNYLGRSPANGQIVPLVLMALSILLFLWLLGDLLTPFLITIVSYYLLDKLTDKLLGYKLLSGFSRPVATTVVLLFSLGALALVLVILAPFAVEQLTQLINNIVANLESKRLEQLVADFFAAMPFQLSESVIGDFTAAAGEFISDAAQLQQILNSGVLFTMTSAANLFETLVYAIVIPIVLYFLLHDKQRISAWFRRLLPARLSLARSVWTHLDMRLGDYVRGKVMEVIILTSVCLIGFSILGLNYAVLLSTLVGLAAVVPILGLIVVTIPVVVIAWLQWGFGELFWYLLVFYTLVQAADGYILIPLLFGEVIDLHPLAIIVGILLFGSWFGIWGVFFAIPLVILVQAILIFIPEELRREEAETS